MKQDEKDQALLKIFQEKGRFTSESMFYWIILFMNEKDFS